jgi:Spy/CpxP family protein refolding chaperone
MWFSPGGTLMEAASKNKWQVRIATVAIFALGFAAGALALTVYRGYHPTSARSDDRGKMFEKALDGLNLSDDQRARIDQILADTRSQLKDLRKESQPKFMQVREQTRQRIQQVLTPDQWQQFQEVTKRARDDRGQRRWRGDDQ